MKLFTILALSALSLTKVFAQKSTDTVYSLYYKTNEWQLDSEKVCLLATVFPNIKTVQRIEAFTDSFGSIKSNYKLSINRGLTVEKYLTEHQLNPTEQTIFWGEKHSSKTPLDSNRRVDIYCSINKGIQQEISSNKPYLDKNELSVIKDSIVLNLDNIFFVPDRAFVEANSVKYLEPLAEELKKYNAKTIEIVGHSNKGSTYYYWLSEQRAKTIYDFLITKGFAEKTMSYIGLGNSRRLFIHPESEQQMRKNMRVEVIIKF